MHKQKTSDLVTGTLNCLMIIENGADTVVIGDSDPRPL